MPIIDCVRSKKFPIESLPKELQGKVLAFAGNTAVTSQVSRSIFPAMTRIANEEIYDFLASDEKTLMGRTLKALPPVLLDKQKLLKMGKEKAVEALSAKVDLVKRMTGGRMRECREIIAGRDLSTLSYGDLNRLDLALRRTIAKRRAKILVDFCKKMAFWDPEIREFLDSLPRNSSEMSQAHRIRDWLFRSVITIGNGDELNDEEFIPSEVFLFRDLTVGEQELVIMGAVRHRDLDTLIALIRSPNHNAHTNKIRTALSVAWNLSDLNFIRELKKLPEFQDPQPDDIPRPSIFFGLSPHVNAVFREWMSFPRVDQLPARVIGEAIEFVSQYGHWDIVREMLDKFPGTSNMRYQTIVAIQRDAERDGQKEIVDKMVLLRKAPRNFAPVEQGWSYTREALLGNWDWFEGFKGLNLVQLNRQEVPWSYSDVLEMEILARKTGREDIAAQFRTWKKLYIPSISGLNLAAYQGDWEEVMSIAERGVQHFGQNPLVSAERLAEQAGRADISKRLFFLRTKRWVSNTTMCVLKYFLGYVFVFQSLQYLRGRSVFQG